VASVDLDRALNEFFGFTGFRPGQREACEAALDGRDALVVMPTGSGKSLCYQLPALVSDNLAIVVSPLVALMQDQVEALQARGHQQVALVNSQQDSGTNRAAIDAALAGQLRLLYVAPERFSAPGFLDRMMDARVGLFVVDEAHCVSQWGHDFRPDYFRLADAARYVGARSLMASTATATPQVATDVVRRLALRDAVRITTGFDRPNLAFSVARPAPHEKRPLIAQALRDPQARPAIVYAGTRKGAEELANLLPASTGASAEAYHAGLPRERRAAVQRAFLADEIEVIVATNAFGMGVDKPNVRTVLHSSVPGSLEAYYQEAGRAGRDGAPARALLLAENRDKALHVHFIKRDELSDEMPRRIAGALRDAVGENGRYEVEGWRIESAAGCNEEQLRSVIGHLARAGVVDPLPAAPERLVGRVLADFDGRAAGLCRASMGDAGRARWRQYRDIWAYVEEGGCRRKRILRHFGDPSAAEGVSPCCDVCDEGLVPSLPAPDPVSVASLDEAILSVAQTAQPRVGRTTCAAILHGAKTKKIASNSYDGLPAYGASSHLRRVQIIERIDELIAAGELATTAGPYPVLSVAA
jgi:ATP-dependent DNA helicase RecQ